MEKATPERYGFKVTTALSGEKALEIAGSASAVDDLGRLLRAVIVNTVIIGRE